MGLSYGSYANGQIPLSALTALSGGGYAQPGTAARFEALSTAFQAACGYPPAVVCAYRDLATQKALYAAYQKGGTLAAWPGTSNHGWGRAIDFGSGIANQNSAQFAWMKANAGAYGWVPAGMSFAPAEPWHWEDTGTVTAALNSTQIFSTNALGNETEMRLYQISDGGLQGTMWGLAPGAMCCAASAADGLMLATALNPSGAPLQLSEQQLRTLAGYLGIPATLIAAGMAGANWSYAKDAATVKPVPVIAVDFGPVISAVAAIPVATITALKVALK